MKKTVAVLGEGAWGTAVATLLAHNGYHVKLWCHDPVVQHAIETTRYNHHYLPSIYVDKKISAVTSLADALQDVTYIFEAIPVQFMRSVIEQSKKLFITEPQHWIILSKGIEVDTLLLPSQIIEEVVGINNICSILVGPSFATELASQKITAFTLAMLQHSDDVQKMVSNEYIKLELSTDIIGVQLCAALKNIFALLIGLLEKSSYAYNTQAWLLTRCLDEIKQLVMCVGGQEKTIISLSGIGDMFLSFLGNSRNKEIGKKIAQGQQLNYIQNTINYVPESINTLQAVYQLIQKNNLHMPMCAALYEVVLHEQSLEKLLQTI